ncbi:MAG TPA: CpsD/CapB family tyrosine-protein kinase [Phycisphaerae bacterium]|nr:CpsD/CapB family tyrosine-protein kinase [Phycisphaerae bacterium]
MSSIADALKRAQQERERLRDTPAGPVAEAASHADEHSLASVVFRKSSPRADAPVADRYPAVSASITPLTEAIRQSPPTPPPAVVAQRRVAETIVEDYASKRKLNLPQSMVVYHDRSGPFAEQYRKMRDNLMLQNPRRETHALVVTSSIAGEGKTVSVLNLGLSLVEIRANRVLLIDGCMHESASPSLTALLKMQPEHGLAELLLTPDIDIQPFLKATPWHQLFVLPSGAKTTPHAAAGLLSSPAWRTILKNLHANFDWILIDAPSVLALPDAGLLAAASDGILLAAALHHTPRARIQTALRKLKSMNLPVKSCFLTHA